MFCHNCGKDCGDFKFCPHCGTQVKIDEAQTAVEAVWAVGKPCPQCGGTEISNGRCAFCGVQLVVESPKHHGLDLEEVSSEIPCGTYDGVTSSLTLYEQACVVRTTILFFKKYETQIRYDQITAVTYVRSMFSSFSTGHLLFRWAGNKNVPIPANNNFAADATTVSTSTGIDTLFYHIYYMLKAVAPKTAEFKMVIPPVDIPDLDMLAAQIDLDSYFERFAPYRSQAVEEMCKRHGVSKDAATALVNKVFDARQKEIYEKNPMEAIWDLNLIVKRKNKEEVQAAKVRAEKKARITRELILEELREQNRR